ncbi:unnamed protein product [Rotaria sp. Silwood1]|nr:unnamed protein product [Rotaria sp. Silwood1]CAF1613680.1 unnamed protein product [Rotaria sp. Silwood1]CAF3699020.1 unnamed protein product [Rotaria sp. Silwood1]CAF3734097.1 unnamed protein product [Rotaria sp. Silwood1]CAF3790054.1 unnamed protein product [Rotaria sp. Silwood1]
MSLSSSLTELPREVIYLIFQYLKKEHIAYAFFGLNKYFTSAVKYFIGQELNLTKISNEKIFQFCLSTLLPSIGFNLRSLSIGYPHTLSTYIKYVQNYCTNLDILNIYCYSDIEDIRSYATYLIHHQLMSFILMYNDKIVGEELSIRLMNKYEDEEYRAIPLSSFLIFNLSSMNDLILLKQFSESSYLLDGLYMIQCVLTGEWFTDSKDDLCIMSKKLHRDSIFYIKQIDVDRCSREYELYHEGTQRRLTVLIPYEEGERWISSSILSTHRRETSYSCSTFTFERIGNDNQFYIRPCYANARRLQVSGKRIIVSLCDNQNTLNHRFRFNYIS